jgi:hypothetical protein
MPLIFTDIFRVLARPSNKDASTKDIALKTVFTRLLTLILLLFAPVILLAVQAQDDELIATFYFPNGTRFEYPAVWNGEMFEGIAAVYDDNYYIVLLNDEALAERGLDSDAELIDVLGFDFEFAYISTAVEINPDAAQELLIDGREALRYRFDDALGGGVIYAVRFTDGGAGLLHSYGNQNAPPDEAITRAILQSFDTGSMRRLIAEATEFVRLADSDMLTERIGFRYPDTWGLQLTDENALLFDNQHTIVLLARPQLEAAGIEIHADMADTLPSIFEYANTNASDVPPFDPANMRRLNLNGRILLRYDYSRDVSSFVSIFMLPFIDGTYGAMIAITSSGLHPETTMLAIANAFDVPPPEPRQPVALTEEATEAATAESTLEATLEATAESTLESAAEATAAPEITATIEPPLQEATEPPVVIEQVAATEEAPATPTNDPRDILAPDEDEIFDQFRD